MKRPRTLVRSAYRLDASGLGARVVSGAGFQFLGIVMRTLITIGSTAVLARLLSPSDFGYLAMATVVTEFAALFGNFGFANVLIQRQRISRMQLETVFWASVLLGSALALIVFAASYFIDLLFPDPLVGQLLRWLCLSFPIAGLSAYAWVVLARLMRFRTEFWIQMSSNVIRAVVAVALAYAGAGVWSLVAGALTGVVINVVLSFIWVPFLPRLRMNLGFLKSIWRTSGGYFGNGFLYYVAMNVDLLLIGRALGAAPLGFYQNARSLTDEIRARIAMPIQHVLFPAFSALQQDLPRFQSLVLRSGRMLAAVVIPVGFGVSANAPELVLTLYGEQWRSMTPVMAMFGLSAAMRASTAIASPLFNATDRVGLALKYNIAFTVMQLAGVAWSLPYGIEAVANTVAALTLFALLTFWQALTLIGLGLRHVGQVLLAPALASGLMWLATAAARSHTSAWTQSAPALLLLHVVLGAAVYLLCLHLISRQYLRDLLDLLGRFKGGR